MGLCNAPWGRGGEACAGFAPLFTEWRRRSSLVSRWGLSNDCRDAFRRLASAGISFRGARFSLSAPARRLGRRVRRCRLLLLLVAGIVVGVDVANGPRSHA